MSEETRFPDAVVIPASWKGGGNALERGQRMVLHAERLLGLDHASGQRAHVRHAPRDGASFCTPDIRDTMFFPTTHKRAGESRYRWERQDDGTTFGYFVDDEAREVCRAAE